MTGFPNVTFTAYINRLYKDNRLYSRKYNIKYSEKQTDKRNKQTPVKTEVAEIITNGRSVLRKSVSSAVERCKLKSVVLFKLECGSVSNVMAALPNIGGALCSTPQFS